MTKRILFFRTAERFTGGELKVRHYFEHLRSLPDFDPYIYIPEGDSAKAFNLWRDVSDRVVNSWNPEAGDAIMLAGIDWDRVSSESASNLTIPVLNLIQGVRHANPQHKLFGYLSNPAIRICVSPEVHTAIVRTGRVRGPLFTVPMGIDAESLSPYREKRKKRGVLIVANKNPRAGSAISDGLSHRGIPHYLLDHQIDRAEFLSLVGVYEIVVFVPFEFEGFFMPALEAMALGAIVVCPDCVGNRSFCAHGVNCFRPSYSIPSLLEATVQAWCLDSDTISDLLVKSRETVDFHSLEREKYAFAEVVKNISSHWEKALQSETVKVRNNYDVAAYKNGLCPKDTAIVDDGVRYRAPGVRSRVSAFGRRIRYRWKNGHSKRNVILTGVPRSGTTLTCHLLNKLEGVVALHEPFDVTKFSRDRNGQDMVDRLQGLMERTRSRLIRDGLAPSTHTNGIVPDNHVTSRRNEAGVRISDFNKGMVRFSREFDESGTLVAKHPSAFTAMVKTIVTRFPTFAIVRNPIAVLGAWNSVEMNVRHGRAPAAERLNYGLRLRLNVSLNEKTRQLQLLEWFFEQYVANLPPASVIRYEDIVSSGGRALAVISPKAKTLNEPLMSKNTSLEYDHARLRKLADAVMQFHGAAWLNFYKREELEAAREGLSS